MIVACLLLMLLSSIIIFSLHHINRKDPKRLASFLGTENEESCTTYNMLKVSRHLFRWTKEMAYADYYERALTNGVLTIQRGREPGVMIYMLPLGHGESKARSENGWGTKFDSFWCCYGTGIESFSKLGDSIYFEEEGKVPGIYVIQYISSSLDWDAGKISIVQNVEPAVSWDNHLRLALTISSKEKGSGQSTLNLRIPFWTHLDGAKAALNDQPLSLPNPGNFLSITREWGTSDKIALDLPVSIRTEAIKDDRPEYASDQAILYGPYLLAGLSIGDRDIKTEASASPSDWITPIPAKYNSHLISLSKESKNTKFVVAKSKNSFRIETLPEPGSNHSVHATFRLILKDSTPSNILAPKDFIGKSIMLEPFDYPGMVVMQKGEDQHLGITDSSSNIDSVFRLVAGLDEKKESVSLESKSRKGCFLYSDLKLFASVKLRCSSKSSDAAFKQGVSFTMSDGISQYDPISFVAKGGKRNFLLQPLLSIRDENYVVYFKIQSNKE